LKIIDVQRHQHGRRRIRFFQESEWESNIHLLKISPTNKILWNTAIDTRRDYNTFGRDLILLNSDILVSTSFQNRRSGKRGEKLFLIGESGRIKQTHSISSKRIFTNNNRLLFTTLAYQNDEFNSNMLVLYALENTFDTLLPIETIVFDDEIRRFWVVNFREGKKYNYIFTRQTNLVIKLDKDNRYLGHWQHSSTGFRFIDGVITPNNSIVILANHFSIPAGCSVGNRVNSVRLIELTKNENFK